MPVELNQPGAGWHWDFKANVVRVDPKDLLDKPMNYLRFVISHEGGHRRISRTDFIPMETWRQPGFSFMLNLQNEVFKDGPIPPEYGAAIREFEAKKATDKPEELKINQLTRQAPVEALYDMIVRYQQTGERLMEHMFTWTKRRAWDGDLVAVGYFDSDGVNVYRYRPGRSPDNLGVSFSRSR